MSLLEGGGCPPKMGSVWLKGESWDVSVLFWEAPSLSFRGSLLQIRGAGETSEQQGSEPPLHFHTRLGESIR